MTYLAVIIVAIALTSSILFLYSSSLNEKPFIVNNQKIEIENQLNLLQMGYRNKLSYTDRRLDESNWVEDISNYIRVPVLKHDYEFRYGSNTEGYYFCITSVNNINIDNTYFDAIKALSVESEYMYLDNECGAINNNEIGDNSVVSLTFYVGG